jgi:uncharacterized membrane protein HdeD (DUF308 family)
MLDLLARNWWLFAIRGVAAIIFGILAFAWPGETLAVLVLFFAAYLLVDGVALVVSLIRGDSAARRHAWAVGIMGVLSVVAGIVAFVYPGITAVALLYIAAFWSIVLGAFQLVAAIRVRRDIPGELWMITVGVIAVLVGVYLVVLPGAGLLSLVWLVGIWAVLFGLSSLMFASTVRGHRGRLTPRPA